MQTQNNQVNNENAKYETLGEPATLLVGKTGFIEVARFSDRTGVDGVDDRVAGIRRSPDAVDEELQVGLVCHWREIGIA